jgi:hypothetical protein
MSASTSRGQNGPESDYRNVGLESGSVRRLPMQLLRGRPASANPAPNVT